MPSRLGHRYVTALYAPLQGQVELIGVPSSYPDDESELRAAIDGIDLFHMHWPELLLEPRIDLHRRLIALLQERDVRIVWTQHNLLPHEPHPAWPAIYDHWADAAHGVIHHSVWGRERATSIRAYRADAFHIVVNHGHWGDIRMVDEALDRETLARPYRMDPGRTHLGILGAPRAAKDLALVVDAFRACDREDLDLSIFSRRSGERLTSHPRIYTRQYTMASRPQYNQRLAFLDVLVLPFREGGSMLTTGLIGDVIGSAKPAIISDWPFLTETLGGAATVYGNDAEGLHRVLESLDVSTLDEQSQALRALQPKFSWERASERTRELFEAVLQSPRRASPDYS